MGVRPSHVLRSCLIVAFWFACLQVLCAQEKVVQSDAAVTNVPDYGRGFAALQALGLPDVAGARYVTLRTDPRHEVYTPVHELDDRAWLIECGEGGQCVFLPLGQGETVNVWDIDAVAAARRAGRSAGPGPERDTDPANRGRSTIFSRWLPADPGRDAQCLAKGLSERTDQPDDRQDVCGLTGYVMAAMQFNRAGLKAEANAIFQQLRRFATDRQLVEGAVGQIAEREYAAALTSFRRTGDWGTLITNMESVVSRFGAISPKGAMAARLLRQARERAARGQPLPLTGTGLTELDRTLAAALLTCTQPLSSLPGATLWIPMTAETTPASNSPPTALETIIRRGMESVPLLMALTNDTYLTPIMPDCFRDGVADFIVWHDIYTTGRAMDLSHGKTDAFLTRGQIAAALLHGLVLPLEPGSGSYSWSMSYETQGDFRYGRVNEPMWQPVEEWFAECRGKPAAELAHLYVARGTTDQSRKALSWLLTNGSGADLRRVETILLDRALPDSDWEFVRNYTLARGPEAKGFVEEYISALTNRYQRAPDSKRMKRDDPDRERALSSWWHNELRAIVATTEEWLAGIAAGAGCRYYFSQERFNSLSPERRLSLVLQFAVAATNRSSRLTVLSLLCAPYGHPQGSSVGPMVSAAPRVHADAWRTLLADQRRDVYYGVENDRTTVADEAASLMDRCYGPTCRRSCPSSADRRIYAVRRERALGRLQGVPEERLPPLPCSENVPLARRLQLAKEIKDESETNVLKRVASLSLEDSLALYEEMDWDPELTRKLVPVLARITRVDVAIADTNVSATVSAFLGGTLDRAMIDTALAIGKRTMATNGQIMIVFDREPGFDGTRVMAFEGFPEHGIFEWAMCIGGRHTDKAYCAAVYSWWGEFTDFHWPAENDAGEDARLHRLVANMRVGPESDSRRDLLNGRIVVMAFPAAQKSGR
jgi:hypothetical protein